MLEDLTYHDHVIDPMNRLETLEQGRLMIACQKSYTYIVNAYLERRNTDHINDLIDNRFKEHFMGTTHLKTMSMTFEKKTECNSFIDFHTS